MNAQYVKDLMIALDDYAVVRDNASVLEAIRILRKAPAKLPPQNQFQSPRAALVVDSNQKVIGQIGHLDFLRALEPKYHMLGDLNSLSKAGVSPQLIGTIIENLNLWQGDLKEVCMRARSIKVSALMQPLSHSIDENVMIADAIHKIVLWQTMRVLVTRKDEVIGVLRLADLFDAMADIMDRGE